MELDFNQLKGFMSGGKLTHLPSKGKKKIMALVWLSEHIKPGCVFTEKAFNALLNKLHTFGDPAILRRELYDHYLVNRNPDGSDYRLNPERPSLDELLVKYCGESAEKVSQTESAENTGQGSAAGYSDGDLAEAEDFRNRIHAEALKRVQAIRPDIGYVIDRYAVESYFQQHWDYPGAWYTIVAIPESAGSREALIDTIVRDTLKGS